MSAPTVVVRKTVFDRDGGKCVLCGHGWVPIEFQHRQASGMGGRRRRPAPGEGLALCSECNARAERDLQTIALLRGVKVRRWVNDPELVPVFYEFFGGWHLLLPDGHRRVIGEQDAVARMVEVYGDEYAEWELAA